LFSQYIKISLQKKRRHIGGISKERKQYSPKTLPFPFLFFTFLPNFYDPISVDFDFPFAQELLPMAAVCSRVVDTELFVVLLLLRLLPSLTPLLSRSSSLPEGDAGWLTVSRREVRLRIICLRRSG
jgi:hypothetical protein